MSGSVNVSVLPTCEAVTPDQFDVVWQGTLHEEAVYVETLPTYSRLGFRTSVIVVPVMASPPIFCTRRR